MSAATNARNAVASWNAAGGIRAVFSGLSTLNAVKAMRTAALQDVAALANTAVMNAPTILDGQQLMALYAQYIALVRRASADLPTSNDVPAQRTLEQQLQTQTRAVWSWYSFNSALAVTFTQYLLYYNDFLQTGARIPSDINLTAAYAAAVSAYDLTGGNWELRRAEIQQQLDLEAARLAQQQAQVTAQLATDVEDATRVVSGLADVVQQVAEEVNRPDLAAQAAYWKGEADKIRERRQAAQAQVLALVDAALAHVLRIEAGGTAQPVDLDTGATKKSGVAPLVLITSGLLLFSGSMK